MSRNPTLDGKERQRDDGAETAENDAEGEKGSEGFADAVSCDPGFLLQVAERGDIAQRWRTRLRYWSIACFRW
jgi:hypothetical protein